MKLPKKPAPCQVTCNLTPGHKTWGFHIQLFAPEHPALDTCQHSHPLHPQEHSGCLLLSTPCLCARISCLYRPQVSDRPPAPGSPWALPSLSDPSMPGVQQNYTTVFLPTSFLRLCISLPFYLPHLYSSLSFDSESLFLKLHWDNEETYPFYHFITHLHCIYPISLYSPASFTHPKHFVTSSYSKAFFVRCKTPNTMSLVNKWNSLKWLCKAVRHLFGNYFIKNKITLKQSLKSFLEIKTFSSIQK